MTEKDEASKIRGFMQNAIKVMYDSIQEPRSDKLSPKVGALLIKRDGSEETSYRGELRHGDHAEFTLLERKNRSVSLDGATLYTTLEPCAPGARKHPKLSCAERIVNARILKVWIGIEDPDPAVDRKGIQYLLDHDVEVNMFDADLQDEIRKVNKEFISEAEDRAKKVKKESEVNLLSEKERGEPNADLKNLSEELLNSFAQSANLDAKPNTPEFNRIFAQLGLFEKKKDQFVPTGWGLLLFGKRPQLTYHHATIKATYKTAGKGEDIETIEGSLISQVYEIQSWYEARMGKHIDRSKPARQTVYDFPSEVFREAIINAIVHRDYELNAAPVYFEINDDAIIIKSPGKPVKPLNIKQIIQFNAPSLSRNPLVMYVFDQMKLVEQRGLGFQTIRGLPNYGLPLPIVSYEDPYIIFTFPRNSEAAKKASLNPEIANLNEEELMGYQWLKLKEEVSTRDYANHFNYGYKKAQRHLAKMKEHGLIRDNGEPVNSPYYKYISMN